MTARASQTMPPRPPENLPASYSLHATMGQVSVGVWWNGELLPGQLLDIISALAPLAGVTVDYTVSMNASLQIKENES